MAYQPLKSDQKLSSIYVKRATKELNEDPKQVTAHLASLRRWLSSMPHLTCPSDDTFLLAFLRHAKFSHSKALKRIDNFCTFRTSEKEGYPLLFQADDSDFDSYERMLDMKTVTPLGFADNGAFCLLVKMANFDVDLVTAEKVKQFNQLFNDHLLYDARVQIGGMGLVLDYTGLSVKQSHAMFKPKVNKLETKYYQEAFPIRVNRMIFFNMPSFFDATYKLVEPYLKEKIRSRIMMIQDNLQPAFDALPGLQKLMPREYGGFNKTFDELHAENRQAMIDLFKNRRRISLAVDESKRPETSKNLMRVYGDLPAESMGKQGTYVKFGEDDI
ncbi:hypothetical protein AAHC03_01717 [Spirometra sp. Aus1]